MIGEIVMDGMVVVGDAAGLTLNTGLTVRGMDLAVGSAVAAAEGIVSALEHDDTSKSGLAGYRERFFASYVGKDMKTYAKAPVLPRGRAPLQAVRRTARQRPVRRLQPRYTSPAGIS